MDPLQDTDSFVQQRLQAMKDKYLNQESTDEYVKYDYNPNRYEEAAQAEPEGFNEDGENTNVQNTSSTYNEPRSGGVNYKPMAIDTLQIHHPSYTQGLPPSISYRGGSEKLPSRMQQPPMGERPQQPGTEGYVNQNYRKLFKPPVPNAQEIDHYSRLGNKIGRDSYDRYERQQNSFIEGETGGQFEHEARPPRQQKSFHGGMRMSENDNRNSNSPSNMRFGGKLMSKIDTQKTKMQQSVAISDQPRFQTQQVTNPALLSSQQMSSQLYSMGYQERQKMKEQLTSLKLKSQRRKDEDRREENLLGGRPPRNPLSRANRNEMATKYSQKQSVSFQDEQEAVKASQHLKNLRARKMSNNNLSTNSRKSSAEDQDLKLPSIKSGMGRNLQNQNTNLSQSSLKPPPSLNSTQAVKRSVSQSKQMSTTAGPSKKKSKWQMQSEQFRAAMRASSKKDDGSVGRNQAEAFEVDDDRKQCPHCRRKFNAEPYERHVPICPNNRAKKGKMKI